ncbi:MAG: aldehyde dehydrogenase (NADP(+)) [Ferrimicrobium acidiphilum]
MIATSIVELNGLLDAAVDAGDSWGVLSPLERSRYLRVVADALDDASGELISLAMDECHIAEARLSGELVRTTSQLRLFAEVLEDGAYLGAIVDHPQPQWPPGPRPDLRRMLVPIGPAVVFGAGNFPFAFGVAGGDTSSALAAGCSVVHKAHPGYPRLAKRTSEVLRGIVPDGVFSLIFGDEAGRAAIVDERVQAGAFTGSLIGGRALFDLAVGRPHPIPFYAEMGSLNPVFVTAGAAAKRKGEIVAGYVGSFTLGTGQFCTKPGLLFVPDGAFWDADLSSAVASVSPAPMLNERIKSSFIAELERLKAIPDVRVLVAGSSSEAGTTPSLLTTTVRDLLALRDELLQECFGPTSIVVTYEDETELLAVAEALEGQLTISVFAEEGEAVVERLVDVAHRRAGRVLWNQWPTGVSVTWAMNHGGPYPATTSPLHTSVGTTAIERFLRPVAYQSVPDRLLPHALKEANPLRLPRRVDGNLEVVDSSTRPRG